jgi:AcrR family transcriptional regulator
MDAPDTDLGSLSAAAQRDGRVARRERNRAAILGALGEILGGGNLEPTAEQVATRAGVQTRTLFRHFPDMASLHAELAGRIRAEVVPLFAAVPSTGDAAERVRRLVAARAVAFERILPFKRAGNAMRWRLRFLQDHHESMVRDLRRHLLLVLPELRAHEGAAFAAFELATSLEAWDRLRAEQHLRPERAREAMEFAALAVLAALPRNTGSVPRTRSER